MRFDARMCHTHLLSMLLMPEKFQRAVESYTATAPDVANEGFNGYMETDVVFVVKDLESFSTLWKESYVYPSDRAQWYHMIRRGIDNFEEK